MTILNKDRGGAWLPCPPSPHTGAAPGAWCGMRFQRFQPEYTYYSVWWLVILSGHNSISRVEDNAFIGMDKLEHLYLNDNKIKDIRSELWTGLTSLRWLLLSNNSIARLPDAGFQGLSKLTDLWLYGNDLKQVTSQAWVGLHSLKALFLEKNKITSLPANAFGGLDKLKEVHLHGNKITEIKANIWDKDLRSLHKVFLNDNRIEFIQPGTFAGQGGLTLLRLHGNRLAALPESLLGLDGGCPRAITVTFAGNPLQWDEAMCWVKRGCVQHDYECGFWPPECYD